MRELLIDIKKKGFTSDGCECGEYGYKLNENLYLFAYRSCRKSGNTPDYSRWKIHDIEFYTNLNFYKDEIECEPEDKIEIMLDKNQEKIVMNRLRRVSILETGGTEIDYFQMGRTWNEELGRFV